MALGRYRYSRAELLALRHSPLVRHIEQGALGVLHSESDGAERGDEAGFAAMRNATATPEGRTGMPKRDFGNLSRMRTPSPQPEPDMGGRDLVPVDSNWLRSHPLIDGGLEEDESLEPTPQRPESRSRWTSTRAPSPPPGFGGAPHLFTPSPGVEKRRIFNSRSPDLSKQEGAHGFTTIRYAKGPSPSENFHRRKYPELYRFQQKPPLSAPKPVRAGSSVLGRTSPEPLVPGAAGLVLATPSGGSTVMTAVDSMLETLAAPSGRPAVVAGVDAPLEPFAAPSGRPIAAVADGPLEPLADHDPAIVRGAPLAAEAGEVPAVGAAAPPVAENMAPDELTFDMVDDINFTSIGWPPGAPAGGMQSTGEVAARAEPDALPQPTKEGSRALGRWFSADTAEEDHQVATGPAELPETVEELPPAVAAFFHAVQERTLMAAWREQEALEQAAPPAALHEAHADRNGWHGPAGPFDQGHVEAGMPGDAGGGDLPMTVQAFFDAAKGSALPAVQDPQDAVYGQQAATGMAHGGVHPHQYPPQYYQQQQNPQHQRRDPQLNGPRPLSEAGPHAMVSGYAQHHQYQQQPPPQFENAGPDPRYEMRDEGGLARWFGNLYVKGDGEHSFH